ncbi:TlyA family RNA methyltransferase [bacterium]|nr:TlyA family RNA methyltransferase [bacterium]
MKINKVRLDLLLVERNLAPSREKAKALLMSGEVFVNGVRMDKAGTMVDDQAEITLKGRGLPFASRGGFKLEKALQAFGISPQDKVVADLGASTGGFTDCLLKGGAKSVYAVDVGYGLLDYKLQQDPRVTVMDRTNARYLKREQFPEPPDLVTMDLSFISLELVIPAAKEILAPGGRIVCLIKPQFEAGRENVGKGGVVRDPEIHRRVLRKFTEFCANQGLRVENLSFSPIKGPAGNIEFLGCLSPETDGNVKNGRHTDPDIEALVSEAWQEAK